MEDLYREARARHRRGHLDLARELYLQVLQAHPEHAKALHGLGSVDLRLGRLEDAERLIRKAIEIAPRSRGFHNNLGNVLKAQSRFDEAIEAYREELRQRPDFAIAHHQIGASLLEKGQLSAAMQAVQRAIFYAPEFAEAYNTLAKILNNLGRLDEAREALLRATRLKPAFAEAYFNLGHVTRRAGESMKALGYYLKAVELDPEYQAAYRNIGVTYLNLGRPQDAIDHLERALDLDSNDAVSHHGLGVIFQDRSMLAPAKRHFEKAIAVQPDFADAHCNLAAVFRSAGAFDKAKTHFRTALKHQANHIPAVSGLANVLEMEGCYEEALEVLEGRISAGDTSTDLLTGYATVLERLDRHAEAAELLTKVLAETDSNFDRMVLHFKLGVMLDHATRYEEALEHFQQGNRLKQSDFEPASYEWVVKRIIKAYGRRAMKRLPRSKCDNERPVFIVGMPRSGTSLVEQILASHADIHGGGELNTIGMMALGLDHRMGTQIAYPECITSVSQDILTELGREYLSELEQLDNRSARITDKMWQNFESVGFVELLLPRARVIHCTRDPRDTALSCYFHLFGAGGIPFSYDLDHIIAAMAGYRSLMKHWQAVCSLPIHEIHYEHLVAEPDKHIPELIEFVGLPWDERCLRFYETRRPVTTASYHQVKQPIYTKSVGRYKNYAPFLDGRLDALESC